MTDLPPEIIDRVTVSFMHMTTALTQSDLAVLAAEANELADYLAGLLAPPDPYADKALRPGLDAVSYIHAMVNVAGPPQTKSSGDPTFDPTLPKDAV